MDRPAELLDFIAAVIDGHLAEIRLRLESDPDLAIRASPCGATRRDAERFFFPAVAHYLYAGDTPLHLAAAACRTEAARLLVEHGADCRARNRLGAEPLHYAARRGPDAPETQGELIRYLVSLGGEPNARDRSGAAPLHLAVRARSADAVRVLLELGADAKLPNGSGSTPLHLAVQPTGRGGAGSPEALAGQAEIIRLLLRHGARAGDLNAAGRSALDSATRAAAEVLLAQWD